MRLLLVEDDTLLGDGLHGLLKQEGYAVDWVQDGQEAEEMLEADPYDVLLLDLGLPGQSGLEVLQKLRSLGKDLPVLILTARDGITDRVAGLDAGADDYLVKPFDFAELLARVRALLRRRHGRAAPRLAHGEVTLDPAAHTVSLAGAPVDITPREFAVLEALLSHTERVLTRGQLEQAIYDWSDDGPESNAIEVYVHHLRRKLGRTLITTVRGVGYTIRALETQP